MKSRALELIDTKLWLINFELQETNNQSDKWFELKRQEIKLLTLKRKIKR